MLVVDLYVSRFYVRRMLNVEHNSRNVAGSHRTSRRQFPKISSFFYGNHYENTEFLVIIFLCRCAVRCNGVDYTVHHPGDTTVYNSTVYGRINRFVVAFWICGFQSVICDWLLDNEQPQVTQTSKT
jgi:hypothetical protein